MTTEPLDCHSEPGQIMGLVDGLNHFIREVVKGDFSHPEVQKSLADLNDEPAFRALVAAAKAASDQYHEQTAADIEQSLAG